MNNIKYNKLPTLIPVEILERASKLSSAQLADGMKGLGIKRDGCMDASILPVNDSMKVIGTAYTVNTDNGDNLPIHMAVYQGQPGYVLIIDGKGHDDHAYVGDLLISAAKVKGLNGVVIDGYVRDKATLNELNFPVFCRGFMQRGPLKDNLGEINTKISCGGVEVLPGDLIYGDYDGVTVIPRNIIHTVLENAERKSLYEGKRRKSIDEYNKCKENGEEPPELEPDWVSDLKKKYGLF